MKNRIVAVWKILLQFFLWCWSAVRGKQCTSRLFPFAPRVKEGIPCHRARHHFGKHRDDPDAVMSYKREW